MNREAWLLDFVDHVHPWFAEIGAPLPEAVRISVGFSSKGVRSNRIGECWSGRAATDGAPQIFVHPRLSDGIEVGGVVVHELIHAAIGTEAKHGPLFKAPALALGLEGRMTATTIGPALRVDLERAVEDLGPYPHASLSSAKDTPSTGPKQTTRMLKCECFVEDCGYLVRTTQKWLDLATPRCPIHDEPMEVR